jgi:hypothetical protein
MPAFSMAGDTCYSRCCQTCDVASTDEIRGLLEWDAKAACDRRKERIHEPEGGVHHQPFG